MNKTLPIPELSAEQCKKLAALEANIDRVQRTSSVEIGRALGAIHSEKLYRSTHASFGDYTEARHQIKQSRAYQLIRAAKTHDALAEAGVEDLPINENQLRAFSKLSGDEAIEAWGHALRMAGSVAAITDDVAKEVAGPLESGCTSWRKKMERAQLRPFPLRPRRCSRRTGPRR